MIIGDHHDLEERLSIIDKHGQVDRHVEDFDFFMQNPAYEYRGYRRVNGIVYHVFWYECPGP